MSIKEFIKFQKRIDKKIKIAAILLSVILSILLTSSFNVFSKNKGVISPMMKKPDINKNIQRGERLITFTVHDSSQFVLEALRGKVFLDILGMDGNGIPILLARDARLVDVIEKGDPNEGYIVVAVLNREDALRVIKAQNMMQFSIMIKASKNEGEDSIGDDFNEISLEIIEELGEAFE